ncbi:AAA family ATPase [Shimia aestuarii]|uniref:AAA family ATPase n=1 Tax=Shimia aestuarii TaxID=254406 RepID=UPI001FB306C5|nr:ATP-binding protein [Shimia aestuarii]
MFSNDPTLHMICGKIAAGKSTLCAELAQAPGHVRLSEDAWLAALYGEEMSSLQDYVRYAARLRAVVGPHVAALLREGVSVVLDFQANTRQARDWMRGILDESGATHVMHVLDVPDEVCLARLAARNAAGGHEFAPSEAQFREISRYFTVPTPEEGFAIQWHD